jgi:DNA-binding transcriptional MerR regulator
VWAGQATYRALVPDHHYVTTAMAARELGVSRRTLSRYASEGILRPTMVLPSGHMRWDLDDLRRQLRELRIQRAED